MGPGRPELPVVHAVRRAQTPAHACRRRCARGGGARQPHPGGHPEGYLEGFANIYRDLAEQITARFQDRKPDPLTLWCPTVEDGARGVKFIETAVESSRRGGVWLGLMLGL